MQLKLTLQTRQEGAYLPFNYQYPLSAAIYKIIQSADRAFASFLHDTGYASGHKNFKLFTFSDIRTPFQKHGDRMQMQSNKAEVITCFYVPKAAEIFIKGLFIDQQLHIADNESKTVFQVAQVEVLPEVIHVNKTQQYQLQPLSPLVVGKKNNRGHYDYCSPEDEDFIECLLYNWLEKYNVVHEADQQALENLKSNMYVSVRLFSHPPQQRLITIKAGTDAETKIRGYMKFRLNIVAPPAMMELALGAGLGLHNAQGMGCVGVV